MLYKVILVLAMASVSFAASNSTHCSDGFWGDDCLNACGECLIKDGAYLRTCDPVSGKCPSGCVGDYKGDNCDQAKCSQCADEFCLAPNFCGNCGSLSKVSPNCEDIRIRGLLGAMIAMIVITASISFCGFGSIWYKRHSNSVD